MKPKILLIEDDKPTIQFYEELFRMNGFEIETLALISKNFDI